MKHWIRLLMVLAFLFSPLWVMGIAYGMNNPSGTPSVSNLHVNRYLLNDTDVLYYGDYDIPYASVPSVFADDAYIFQLIGTDNSTELGVVTPFVFFDNGYNEGVFGFYFSDASTSNITWGTTYSIKISQNPTYFTSPQSWSYVVPANVYTSANTTAANQSELAINIISAANRLEQIYTTYTLLDTAAAGTVLSSPEGETYFRGAIQGVQGMAPSLFLVQVLEYDTTGRTWTTDYSDNLTKRFETTWVGASENATAAQFGMTNQTAMGIVPLGGAGMFIIVSMMKWRRAEPGFIAATVIMIMGLLMGWLSPAIFASVFQLMGIYIAYLLFLARAG